MTEVLRKETMEYYELLSPEMRASLEDAGYTEPTPIQEQTLAALMEGRDVIGVAQTGTGKTAAFAVPIIEKTDPMAKLPQALILCPTRELAIQITTVFRMLTKHKPRRTVSVYGGQSPNVQIRALDRGAQIIAGTPGRVKDMIKRGVLKLTDVRMVVLDEADEMLDFGFLPDISDILKRVKGPHQTMLFSATMNPDVAKVAKRFQHDPETVTVGRRDEPVDTVRQTFIQTGENQKCGAVCSILKLAMPRLTLIFCNTKRRTERVQHALSTQGLDVICLHGDMRQRERDAIMKRFREGTDAILVATDVAARGLDIDQVDLVVNFDVPDKPDYYVHRIGRTGRAGHSGMAFTLVSPDERPRVVEIKKKYRIKTDDD